MARYQTKPDIVDAVQVTAADYNPAIEGNPWDGSPFSEMPDWIVEAVSADRMKPHTRGSTDYAQWDIVTPYGTMSCGPGDYIIRCADGELYPCKPDIFEATYDPIDTPGAGGGE